MARWKAQVENTSVPGGAFALQVRPSAVQPSVTFVSSSDTDGQGRRLGTVTWRTNVIAVREAELQPSGSKPAGFVSRPHIGRIVPPWIPSRAASLQPMGPATLSDNSRVRWGSTPAGTRAGGPTHSEQLSLPRTGGPVHKIFHWHMHYPDESPLLVFGSGTHNYATDGRTIPVPAVVLYCSSSISTTEQTFHGSIIFEEL
ncbi:MAG: hypothetical protein V3T22_11230 [Planctomycetota bacterium]